MRLVSVAAAAALSIAAFAAAQTKELELRVMTFNVRNEGDRGRNAWANRRPLVAQVIREFQPDVVGLQESSGDRQLEDLDQMIPGMRLVQIPNQGQARRNSILYRTDRLKQEAAGYFWYSDTPEQFTTHWGNTYPRSCTWVRFIDRNTGRAFYHFNTHLDHQSENSRRRSAVMLARRVAERPHKDPFVVTGDFNSAETSAVLKYLRGGVLEHVDGQPAPANLLPLIDTFRVDKPDAADVGTSIPAFDGKTSGVKIDYILTRGCFQVLSANIVTTNKDGLYPSDHLPVAATIRYFGGCE